MKKQIQGLAKGLKTEEKGREGERLRKKKVNSKKKGDSFEREVAKRLEEHLGLPFRRTPLSGGFSNKWKSCIGDIMCPDNFGFYIDCKSYRDFDLLGVLSHKGSSYKMVMDNWERLEKDKGDRKSLLIVKKTGFKNSLVFIGIDCWKFIQPAIISIESSISFGYDDAMGHIKRIWGLFFEDFLKMFPKESEIWRVKNIHEKAEKKKFIDEEMAKVNNRYVTDYYVGDKYVPLKKKKKKSSYEILTKISARISKKFGDPAGELDSDHIFPAEGKKRKVVKKQCQSKRERL